MPPTSVVAQTEALTQEGCETIVLVALPYEDNKPDDKEGSKVVLVSSDLQKSRR